jgi:hypothetical protein
MSSYGLSNLVVMCLLAVNLPQKTQILCLLKKIRLIFTRIPCLKNVTLHSHKANG